MHVFELWGVAGVAGENPCRHKGVTLALTLKIDKNNCSLLLGAPLDHFGMYSQSQCPLTFPILFNSLYRDIKVTRANIVQLNASVI